LNGRDRKLNGRDRKLNGRDRKLNGRDRKLVGRGFRAKSTPLLTGQTVLETTFVADNASKTVPFAHLPVGLNLYVDNQVKVDMANGEVAVVQ